MQARTDWIPYDLTVEARFEDLFARYYAELVRLCKKILGESMSAEDVVQEAFVKLSGTALLQRPDAEIAAWLRRVCLNATFNRLRGDRREQARLERVMQLDPEASEASEPGAESARREEQQRVRGVLAQLPAAQRECLILRHSGYSYAEIASTLGLAVGSVGVYLTRGERAFRALYEETDHDVPR